MRNLALAGVLLGVVLLASPALAWTPPPVGVPCQSARHFKADTLVIAGNYLGGRAVRDGVVDWKSFQACFHDVASCEQWLGRQASVYPLRPGFARCTPLRVGYKR